MGDAGDMMDVWAVVDWGKPLEKIQQPIPVPQGTEVLIKVSHAGVCHSDLHFQDGYYELGQGKRTYVKDRGVTLPVAGGHEIYGTVAKTGPDAISVPIGAQRAVYPWLGCGQCRFCQQDEDNMCSAQKSLSVVKNGGYAEYVLLPHPKYLADTGDVDPAVACTFGCSAITTLNAVSHAFNPPLKPDEPIVLIGAGGVGLAAISILKGKFGHKNIISVDIADDKLAKAKEVGATKVVNSSGSEPGKRIIEAAGGQVMAVIDFVGTNGTAAMMTELCAKGAKWVNVGILGGTVEVSLVWAVFRSISIIGSITGNPKQLQEVAALAREGKLPPVPVKTMSWNRVNEAFQLLREGKVLGRIVLIRD